MPPRRQPVATATGSRAARASKDKARVTIKSAIGSKRKDNLTTASKRQARAPANRPAGPQPSAPPPPSSAATSETGGDSDDQVLPANLDSLMQNIKTLVRDTIREERGKEGSIVSPVVPAVEGTIAPPSPFVFPPAADPHHALKRWPWVPQDTLDLIDHGKFDIDSLPKLHRSDELRNAYLRRTLKGIYQPLEGGPPEIIIGNTKLQSSFKDSTTFFLAWHIYVSIRSEFKPSVASGLANWTERVLYFVQLNYPWPSILEYVIAYYQLYQTSTAQDAWFDPNPTLMQYHLTLVQQRAPAVPTMSQNNSHNGDTRSRFLSQSHESIADEICVTYNRSSGCTWNEKGTNCPRRHVCIICTLPQHTALNCPTKST
jgi:hypothetical protein